MPTAFRTARQGIHDAIGGGDYAAKIAKAKNLKRWVTCSPDYAYGRSNTAEFMEYAKHFEPSIQVVDESWPKLFQPDYTEVVTKVLNSKADAMYSALWGGDLSAFIDQGNLYGLFDKMASFMVNLGDYGVVDEVKQFPSGVYSGGRYNRTVPPTKENEDWYQAYVKNYKHKPTNWSWENATAATFLVEALKATNGDTDGKKLAAALKGMKIKSPWGSGRHDHHARRRQHHHQLHHRLWPVAVEGSLRQATFRPRRGGPSSSSRRNGRRSRATADYRRSGHGGQRSRLTT